MYYLRKGMFVPFSIFFSLIMMPGIIALLVLLCQSFTISMLIIELGLVLFYVLTILVVKKICSNKNSYIKIENESVEIIFEGKVKIEKVLLCVAQIDEIEFYRLWSLKAWFFSLISLSMPNQVIIKFHQDCTKHEIMIGYLSYKQIKEIAKICNAKIKVI